jgi:hypothetical protein
MVVAAVDGPPAAAFLCAQQTRQRHPHSSLS